ncbi:MAG: substrate-binding domain-containing protein [Akkermansiaceae bacterium]
MNSSRQRVALLLNLQIGYCRRAVTGIAAFAEKQGWLIEEMPATLESGERLARSRPDGVIAHVLDAPFAEMLAEIDCPVMSISSNISSLPFPAVDVDHVAVGRLAADYLDRLGRVNFAFFGSRTAGFSLDRELGFAEVLKSRGHTISRHYAGYVLRPPYDEYSKGSEEEIRHWLGELPKPAAVFCSNDEHARLLGFICQSGDISVPEEVAILGVDNDLTICSLGSPPLSSVDNPAEKIGFRAAAILHDRMMGSEVKDKVVLVPPAQVVERPSTDQFAVNDEVVAKTIAFLKRNLRDGELDVGNLANHVGVSRRTLERAFSNTLQMTVLGAIQRLRIRRASSLLSNTDLPIEIIAGECGFSNHRRLGIVFKGEMQKTPTQFRQANRFSRDDVGHHP